MSVLSARDSSSELLESPQVHPIRVLLVDDHALVRAGLRSILEPLTDITVVGEAGTGEAALDMVDRTHPDVVVMDLDMPGEGGLAATRRLTSLEPHPAVLIVTMHPEKSRVVAALHAGACGYITKDLTDRDLVAGIRAAATADVYVRPEDERVLATGLHHRSAPQPSERASQFEKLSRREQMVLRLVAEGHTGPEIGRQLGITAKTVDTYRHRIHDKIGLARRTDYIRFALEIGLFLS